MSISTTYKSPLHEMAQTTITDYWNDSCAVEELTYAMEHGAVGATSNGTIAAAHIAPRYSRSPNSTKLRWVNSIDAVTERPTTSTPPTNRRLAGLLGISDIASL